MAVKGTGGRTGGNNPFIIHQQHFTVGDRDHTDREDFAFGTGKGFAKQISGKELGQNGAVAENIVPHHLHRAAKHDSHPAGRTSRKKNGVFLGIACDARIQTAQHTCKVPGGDPLKKKVAL
jgi:hypothetical protein